MDVEYSSNMVGDTLFGTNVRFFYDSTDLIITGIENIVSGYGESITLTSNVGVPTSGSDLFNFDPAAAAAVWVNGGIELQAPGSAIEIPNGTFIKAYELCFDIVGSPTSLSNFCPEIIWDLNPATDNGYLPGSDGVVITLYSGGLTMATNEVVENYNWMNNGSVSAPYGDYTATNGGCVSEGCVNCIVPSSSPPLRQP